MTHDSRATAQYLGVKQYQPDEGAASIERRRAHWDRRASEYQHDVEAAEVRARALQELLHRLPSRPRRVLDAGTGTGETARQVAARLVPSAELVGTDLSPEMLRIARETPCASAVQPVWRLASNSDLPYPDGWFDLVTTTFTLHHIPPSGQSAVLAEFARVLAPNGTLLLVDEVRPQADIDDAAMRSLVLQTFYNHLKPEEAVARKLAAFGEWPMTMQGITTALVTLGFEVESVEIDPIVGLICAHKGADMPIVMRKEQL